MSRLAANSLLLLTAAIWGGGFVSQTLGMRSVGPFWFMAIRFVLAALVVAPWAAGEGRRVARPLRRSDLGPILLLGALFFAASALQQVALLHTSVTDVGFLTGLYVLFVPCLGVLLFRERPHPLVWLAAGLALLGTWCLSGGVARFGAGQAMTVVAAVLYSGQILAMAEAVRRTRRPVLVALSQSAICAALSLLVALAREPVTLDAVMAGAPSLLYAGAISGGLAFTFQAIGQQYAPPADAAIVMTLEAPFAALFGALMLGERLDLGGWIGCALIFTSFVTVQLPAIFQRRWSTAGA